MTNVEYVHDNYRKSFACLMNAGIESEYNEWIEHKKLNYSIHTEMWNGALTKSEEAMSIEH